MPLLDGEFWTVGGFSKEFSNNIYIYIFLQTEDGTILPTGERNFLKQSFENHCTE
jgi:hypothetical protein